MVKMNRYRRRRRFVCAITMGAATTAILTNYGSSSSSGCCGVSMVSASSSTADGASSTSSSSTSTTTTSTTTTVSSTITRSMDEEVGTFYDEDYHQVGDEDDVEYWTDLVHELLVEDNDDTTHYNYNDYDEDDLRRLLFSPTMAPTTTTGSLSSSSSYHMRREYYRVTTTPLQNNNNNNHGGWDPKQTKPMGRSEMVVFVPIWEDMSNNNKRVFATDIVCILGESSDLEPNIHEGGYFGNGDSDGSSSCTATTTNNNSNGCGIGLYDGQGINACHNITSQSERHWYNDETLEYNPWTNVKYDTTDSNGRTTFGVCVRTGYTDLASNPDSYLLDRTMIVHSKDGARVSCGLIEKPFETSTHHRKEELVSSKLAIPIPTTGTTLMAFF